jgi:hypothetical protein
MEGLTQELMQACGQALVTLWVMASARPPVAHWPYRWGAITLRRPESAGESVRMGWRLSMDPVIWGLPRRARRSDPGGPAAGTGSGTFDARMGSVRHGVCH